MDSKNYDEIRNLTILFFLDRLVDKGQSRTLHDLSCQFGTKGFTKEMRQIAGGSQSGLRKFLSQYPSLFTIDGEHVSITCYNNGNGSGCSGSASSGGGSSSGGGGSGGIGSSRDYAREAVDYFHDKLDQYGAVEVPIRSLLGHRSQATPEIRHISGQHIREFRDFLLKYSDTFVVHDDYVVLRKHWDSICEGGSNAGGTLGRHEPSPPPPPGVELTPLDQQLIEHVLDFCRSAVESGRGSAVDIEQLFDNLSSRFQRESYTRLVKSPQDLSVLLKMYSDSFLVQGGTVALVPNRPATTTQRSVRPPTTLNGTSALDNGVAATSIQHQVSAPTTPTSPTSASSSGRPSANPPPALQSFKQRLMSHLMKAVADNNALEQRVYQSGAAPAAGNPLQQQQQNLALHCTQTAGTAMTVVSAYDVAQMNTKLLKATKIVTRVKECLAVATHIRSSGEGPVISLDAEGVNLGPSGPMTLLQIGTADGQVFIFDLIACKEMVLEGGLKEILESPHITKVVHDCRNDSAALFHQFQVSLQNVFDTQAAHAVLQQQQTGKPVHKVKNISLNNLCRTYGGPVNPKKEQMKKIYRRDQKFWSRRPLSDDMVLYAGYDIWALVPTIYDAMSALLEGGPSNPLFRQLCAEQTDTYIRIDDVKHNKKMRKIETEVAELKRKLAATSGKSVVLSNREIRLLRHVELTEEEKEKLDGSYKVARKLERLQNRGNATNSNGGTGGSGPCSRSNPDSSEASPEFDEEDDDLYENEDDLDDDLEEEEEDEEDELDFGASDGSSLSPMCSQQGDHRGVGANGNRAGSPSIEDSIRLVEQFLASERFEGLGCLLADEPGFAGMMTASDSCSCLCHHDLSPTAPTEAESKPRMVDAGCQTLSTGDVVITKVHFEDKGNSSPKGGPASTTTTGTATPPQDRMTTSTSTSSLRDDSRKC